MRIDTAIEYADQLLYERTGKHLSDLQSCIIQQSWQGRTYGQVATLAGYSEGHIKDVAAQLWQLLSDALGERITKGNLRSRLINRVKRTLKKAAPDTYESIASIARPMLTPLAQPLTYSVDLSASSTEAIVTKADQIQAEPTHFLGRDQAMRSLQILFKAHRLIVIHGEAGLGKTTLAQQYAQRFEQVLELLMAKEATHITSVESGVEEWLKQNFNEEPGREFGVTLSRLKRHLQAQPAGKVGIVIDNLEPALDRHGQFIASHRHYVELLRVLAQTPASVIMTSCDRLCEPSLAIHHYRLPGLGLEAWQQFFQARQVRVQTAKQQVILSEMHHAYGGNAKAMEILCAATVGDFEGDLLAYWPENSSNLLATADLRNLVGGQVNRLQQLDADAYRVFCRLGCYHCPDQLKLQSAAILALMWDIEPSDQQPVLNALRDRSLLEFYKGEYWLHPVSRAEAIARLRQSPDWQRANQAAARYLQDSIP